MNDKMKPKVAAASFEAKPNEAKVETPNFGAKFEIPKFEMPSMEVPPAVREFAERGLTQVKDGYAKMKSVTDETTEVMEEAYAAAAKGSSDYGLKVIELARLNSNAALDYARDLLAVKSVSEIFEVSSTHARKSFETASVQARELATIAQKVSSETVEPLKSGFTKAFAKVA